MPTPGHDLPSSQSTAAISPGATPAGGAPRGRARVRNTVPDPASLPRGVELRGPLDARQREAISNAALELVADLVRRFGWRVDELLARRRERQARLDAGERPDFLAETAHLRSSEWTVAPLPPDLLDRRVEITGPADRKMIINALNSGASVFMADFEDSSSPTWENNVQGHVNLRDAVRRRIELTAPDTGKKYALADKTAMLFVRPRGWHLVEKHVLVDGRALRLRDLLPRQREGAHRTRHGAVLLPPEAGEPPRGAALERGLRAGGGGDRDPARHDQGDLSHRDLAGRLRDGRDPVGAARALGGPQLRPLGLHLLVHQALPRGSPVRPARPRAGHDGQVVPRRVRAAPHPDLPQAERARDGRDGGADPDQGQPRSERSRAREGPRRQAARGEGGPRRHLGRTPRPRARREGDLRRAHEDAEPDPREARGRAHRAGRPPGGAGRHAHRGGAA